MKYLLSFHTIGRSVLNWELLLSPLFLGVTKKYWLSLTIIDEIPKTPEALNNICDKAQQNITTTTNDFNVVDTEGPIEPKYTKLSPNIIQLIRIRKRGRRKCQKTGNER